MKKIFFVLCVSLLTLPSFAQMRIKREKVLQNKAQQVDTAVDSSAARPSRFSSVSIAQSFVRDLANPAIALDIILSKYVLVHDADDEMYDYLLASLAEIRLNLMSKRIEDIRYVPFAEMPRKEVSDIDPEGQNVDNMIFLYSGKRQLTSLYVEQGKIASFTLVSKGNNRAHFVTY